jgi:two-component system, sensor histidine kinase and response regulator
MVKILVIDDAKDLSEEIVNLLDIEGYETTSADCGWQGIELAKSFAPDLIICDIDMPDLDGYGVFRELHTEAETQLIPFIFLTGKSSKEEQRAGMNLGADDYLTKPFELDELLTTIHTRIERSNALHNASKRKAQAEKEQLIRRISHELRNPITSMKLATSLIRQLLGHDLPAHMLKILGTYQHGVDRLQRLTEQMVIQVKLEAESINEIVIQAEGKAISINALMEAAIGAARYFAHERDFIELNLSLKDHDTSVFGMPDLLKHAIGEIIANALDFSDENRAVVVKQWTKDRTISILVMNEGLGIPPEEIDTVLQPFRRSSNDPDTRKGLGLGLSLANQIIAVHGGCLKIVSSAIGTSVLIQLPAVEY